jgi:hypothetical protein
MVETSGADYDSPRRKSETADRFNFSQVKIFSNETEGGIREPVYVPDSPRFSPVEPPSESMCMSQHPQAVQEFIRENNYQDVVDLLLVEPTHYNRVGKLTVQHYRRARELSWESLEVHGFNTAVRDDASKPSSGEVFAVITPREEPLQIRPDVACRVVTKGSTLARSMMVVQIEARYATFSRDILDKLNAKTSSSYYSIQRSTARHSGAS